jgi:hypothetical protein
MMTKLMLIATLTLTIFMTIGAVAQTNLAGADVKVTIPFNFYAGDQSLPAGSYIVKTEIAHRVIILRGEKTPGLFVTTNRLEAANLPEHGQLTFQALWQQLLLAGSVGCRPRRRTADPRRETGTRIGFQE